MCEFQIDLCHLCIFSSFALRGKFGCVKFDVNVIFMKINVTRDSLADFDRNSAHR